MKKSCIKIETVDNCTGCGTCVGICPTNCIEIYEAEKGIYKPRKIDDEACVDCGLCIECCPSLNLNYDLLNIKVFNKIPENGNLGNYIDIFQGYSANKNVRFNSSSGGFATALICYLLENKHIDAALLSEINSENILRPQPFLAYTSEDVLKASGSKYCPVSLNILINEIIKKKLKVAVVGLPCHLHGLRLAAGVNKKLEKLIFLYVGLFCGKTPSFKATDSLCAALGHEKKILTLSYRGRGWPGLFRAASSERCSEIPFNKCWKEYIGTHFFEPLHCFRCYDFFSDFSDLSLGDAWLDNIADDTLGRSIVIIRSLKGKEIVGNMVQQKKLQLWAVDKSEIESAFSINIIHKKRHNSLKQSRKIRENRFNDSNFSGWGAWWDRVYVGFQMIQIYIGNSYYINKIVVDYPPTFIMTIIRTIEEKLRLLVVYRPNFKKICSWLYKKMNQK